MNDGDSALRERVKQLPGWAWDEVVKRDFRPLWHAASIVAIAALALVLFHKHFSSHGTIIYGDMTFPPRMRQNFDIYVQTWWQYGSNSNFFNIQRLFWAFPFLAVAKVLNLSTAHYLLLMFYTTFVLAGVSMYVLTFSIVKEMKLSSPNRYPIYVGSVLAALIYMYNPWSLGHFWTYFMYPPYALLPLIFLVLKRTFDSPTPRRVVVLVLLLSVSSTMPNCVVWTWLLVISYGIYRMLVERFRWKTVRQVSLIFFTSMGLFLAVNSLWTLPYLTAQAIGKAPVPWYIPNTPGAFQKLSLDVISATCSISTNLRLLSGWGIWVKPMNNMLWVVLSFTLPVAVVLSLVFLRKQIKRNSTIMFWAVFSMLMILLATGNAFILKRPYNYFVLRGPGSYSLGWIFRSPDRWLFFVPTFFALVIGALIARLLSAHSGVGFHVWLRDDKDKPVGNHVSDNMGAGGHLSGDEPLAVQNAELRQRLSRLEGSVLLGRKAISIAVAVLIITAVVLSMTPAAMQWAKEVFAPTVVPKDYEKVNQFLLEKSGGPGLVWVPFYTMGWHYKWAKPKYLIGGYGIYSSPPSINNMQGYFGYFNWLKDLLTNEIFAPVRVDMDYGHPQDLVTRVMIPFASKYVIVDSSVQGDPFNPVPEVGANFGKDTSLSLKYRTSFLKVYETRNSPPKIRVAKNTVRVDTYFDNLSTSFVLPESEATGIAFLNDKGQISKKYGGMNIDTYKQPLVIDGGFEKVNSIEGGQPFWRLANPEIGAKLLIDKSVKTGGRSSLKVVNKKSKAPISIAWIEGPEVPAQAGRIYAVETHVKYRNADWTTVVVEGYQQDSGIWVRLALCPNVQSGTSAWEKWQCSFVVPEGITKIRPRLGAGWAKEASKGPGVSWFDDIRISKLSESFYSELTRKDPLPVLSYTKISPEKYKVSVKNARKPYVLVFGESFDRLWTAKLPNGKKVEPVQLYSVVNGFPIDKTGSYEITIEYEPQTWFYLCLLVSLLVLLGCLLYLVLFWWHRGGREGKGLKQQLPWLGPWARDFFGIRPRRERYGPEREKISRRIGSQAREFLGIMQRRK